MIRDVINELKKYIAGKKNTDKIKISVLVLNRLIFALEEQEPKTGHWIPVSERLPEADGRYLCTYEDDIEENCVDFGSYKNGEWYVDKVIAWMPLPEPYKSESEDK